MNSKPQDAFTAAMQRLAPKETLVLGVSGGMDSMALLELVTGSNQRLVVAHFNHQLRGDESEGDEIFVRDEAARRGLEFRSGRGDVKGAAKGISTEMAARKLRHEFLANVALEYEADLLLAHHADDQIELALIRQARGIVGYGISGIHECASSSADSRVRVLRPLLNIPKSALKEFVSARGLAFREDSSNVQLDTERNRIRNHVLPLLRANWGPETDFQSRIDREQKQQVAQRELAKAWVDHKFTDLDEALKKAIVAVQLERAGIPVTSARLATLLANIAQAVMIQPDVMGTLDADGQLRLKQK